MSQRQSEILMLAGEMIQTKGYDSFSYKSHCWGSARQASTTTSQKQELGLAYLKYRFEAIKDIENQLRQSHESSAKAPGFLDLGVKTVEEKSRSVHSRQIGGTSMMK